MSSRMIFAAAFVILSCAASAGAAPVETAFTYQGQLKLDGVLVGTAPAAPDGSQCYFDFSLFDVPMGGIALGTTSVDMPVFDGLFTADLDFGPAAFDGQGRWLATAVCCLPIPFTFLEGLVCSVSKVPLAPRQRVNAVPYALALRLPLTESAATAQAAIAVINAGQGDALLGSSNGCAFPEGCYAGAGVIGENTSDGIGVRGISTYGVGVFGSGPGDGVRGLSTNANGVSGESYSFGASGVYGYNNYGGYGVAGRATGTGIAILGDHTGAGVAGRFNGDVNVYGTVPAYDFQLSFADVGERIESSERLEPGDVVEIDPERANSFRRAATPYSTLTAGIISTRPAVTLNRPLKDGEVVADPPAAVLALAGRAPVKVTDANGPIRTGDLLTTSSVAGHAMRCDERSKCTGAVVGKALQSFSSGAGIIDALVTLQ